MIQTLRKNIALLITAVVLALSVGLAVPALTSAQDIEGNLCEGASLQFGGDRDCDGSANEEGLNELIANVVNIFSVVVGIIAVIMIIIGGFRYITSGGDSSKVTGAKNTIMYAIIGLIIVALAQVVVRFVLGQSSDLV